MPNLIQSVMGALSPDLTSKLAGALGESPSAVSSGLGAAAPALLAGAVQRSSTPEGAASLVNLVKQTNAEGNPLDGVGALAADDGARASLINRGQGLVGHLLGGEAAAATDAVAAHSGLSAGSASTLMAMAAPMVMGAIGRAAGPSPTAGGVQTLLQDQRSGILGALPSGLGSVFGLRPAAPHAAFAAETAGADAVARGVAADARGATAAGMGAAATARPAIGRYLPWILGALVLVGALFALRNCGAERRTAPTAETGTVATAPAAAPTVSLNLPGGAAVNVPQGSIGYNLANYLQSNQPAPKTFVFDNLNYDTASDGLTADSQPTVSTLASILKAYPNSAVRVVGYTDNQGDVAANQALSERRAMNVKTALVDDGVAADRVQAVGMGEAKPIADNASDEGRARNRRTELEVVKK